MKKIFTLIAACVLGVMGAMAQVVKWNVSNTAYSAGQELSSNTDVVSVKLGETSLSWLYNTGRKGITTYVQGTPANGGSYIVVKPTKDISLSLATYSSMSNCNLKMYEESTPSTVLKDFRQKDYKTNDFGKLEAGKTYYIYGEGFKTVAAAGNTSSLEYIFFQSFTATSYETYNIYYIDNKYSNQIKTHREGSALFGSKVTASSEDMYNIEYAGSTYVYTTGNTEITIGTSSNDITLKFDKAEAAPTTYTIKYQLSDGTEIADAVNHNALVGNEVSATAEEVPTYITKDGVKYKYASGNTPLTLVEDAASNVITLTYAEAPKFNYSVVVNFNGNPIKTVATGWVYEADNTTVGYPQYVVDADGKLYEAPKFSNDEWYRTTFTPNVDGFMQILNYTSASMTGVVFYTEAEDVPGVTVANYTNRASNGKVAHTGGKENFKDVTTLAPGVYKIYVKGLNGNSANRISYFRVGDNNVFSFVSPNGTDNRAVSLEFIVYSESTLKFSSEGSSASGLDWFYVVKTGDAPTTVNVAVNESGTASYVTPCALDFTGSGLTAYVATAINATSITLEEITEVPAGQAIVVKGETSDVNVIASAEAPTVNLFQAGANAPVANAYALSKNDGKFHSVNADVAIPAGKAYIVLSSSSAKSLSLDFGGETTGISNAVVAKQNAAAFNLMGQKVSANAKGIVIINGKKFNNK